MNRIRELRNKKGLTVKELSEIIGISQSMISNYENENSEPRDKEIWNRLASFFDVSVAYIRGFNADKIKLNDVQEDDLIKKLIRTLGYEDKTLNETIERREKNREKMQNSFNKLSKLLNENELDSSKISDEFINLWEHIMELELDFNFCTNLYKEHSKTYSIILNLDVQKQFSKRGE